MKKIVYDNLNEELYYKQLENGLDVYLMPKRGFNKTYATFTTKFGSIDNKLNLNGEEVTLPNGIAHFLEHKLFESEKGDITEEFSKFGANSNAFTTYDRTSYLISCTSNIEDNITLLIDFVQNPYFTDESVEKEKGIIKEEIQMYNDIPDARIMFETMKSIYKSHPVRNDIAGSIESIDKITPEVLYECYETYYHPSNMLLFIVGDYDIPKMMELIENNQREKGYEKKEITHYNFDEELELNEKEKVIEMQDVFPKLMLGVKGSPDIYKDDLSKYKMSMMIYLDILFGRSSENYERLFKDKLINYTFSVLPYVEEKFSSVLIAGDSNDPEKLKDELLKCLEMDVSKESFKNVKKKFYGSMLKLLNSPEGIANEFTAYKFNGIDLFDIVNVVENITFEDVIRLKSYFTKENICSVILKTKAK
ncbi:pitrilysin family protein [Mycoplasmatota bacterium zrk1]